MPIRSLVLFFTCACTLAFGQLGGQTGGSAQQPTANQLPLSGRNGSAGSVSAVQQPTPGTTTSVNTVNTSVQSSGAFSGSVSSGAFTGKLTFIDAIDRGLRFNLGAVGLNQAVRQAKGQFRVARSALLPNLNGSLSETVQQTNLRALGVRFNSPIPGLALPTIVGPFNYFDLRARLSQNLADFTALNNYRSAQENARANERNAEDARDLVSLAVGGAYLQAVAAQERVVSARAQLQTAEAEYQQVSQQRAAGVASQTDLNRTEVQLLTTRERVATLENDLAKQKINLARLTGLPPSERFELTDQVPYSPAPPLEAAAALGEALRTRADLQAAEAQIRAAERSEAAARAERLPSLSLAADYGAIGTNPNQAHGTFSVTGTLRFPIWQGGRIAGDVEQADAALGQRKAEREDLRSRIESDIRNSFLDLETATAQVEVARRNQEVARQTLDLTKQRFAAGIDENVAVIQARESVASADLDYINSVFSHNAAKLSLARAMGNTRGRLEMFLHLH